MLCRKKPSAARRCVRRCLLRLLALLLILLVYFEVAVRVRLTEVIRVELSALAQRAVNTAMLEFLEENGDIGERLTALRIGDSGGVTALTADAAYINFVKADLIRRAQEKIDACADDEGVAVPLGSFTGLILLERVGPRVRMGIDCRAAVSCAFESTLETAGVNQTLHHIVMNVSVGIAVYSPFRIQKGVCVTSDYEIAQTVIVGAVPNYSGVVTY